MAEYYNKFEDAKQFWVSKIKNELGNLDIPLTPELHKTDRGRKEFRLSLSSKLTEKLLEIGKGNDLSIYVILLAAFKIMLYRLSRESKVTVMSPVYNKVNSDYNKFIALLDIIEPHASFKEVLFKIKDTLGKSIKYQYYPMSKIISSMNLDDKSVLYKIFFSYNIIHDDVKFNEIPEDGGNELMVNVKRDDSNIDLIVNFDSKYSENGIEAMLESFRFLLEQFLIDTSLIISEVPLINEEKEGSKESINVNDFINYNSLQEIVSDSLKNNKDSIALMQSYDLTEIHNHLQGKTVNEYSFEVLRSCIFRKNPYLFEKTFSDKENSIFLIKNNRHTSAILDINLKQILDLFEEEISLENVFEIIKNKNADVAICSVDTDDVLEIGSNFSKKGKYRFTGKEIELVDIVKVLFENHLIILKGVQQEAKKKISNRDVNFKSTNQDILSLLESKIDNKNYKLNTAEVLLLGDTTGVASVGIAYLASYLERNGISAYCLFNNSLYNKYEFAANIKDLLDKVKPKFVAISLKWFLHIARVFSVCRIIKEYSPNTKIILGGDTASYYSDEVIKNECVDFVIKGDGELPLLQICSGEIDIPNVVSKISGEIVNNDIKYIHDKSNSSEIYLSDLNNVLMSEYDSFLGTFFIPTQKGCGKQCIYCAGCNSAQKINFNRDKIFVRPIEEIRKDIIEASKYSSSLKFVTDLPNQDLLEFCKKMWEGIDLSSHFCIFTNVIPPTPEVIELGCKTFKYVYWNLDLVSLSENHRKELFSKGLVKKQPEDIQIFEYADECEKYDNADLIINMIAGLPYFKESDIQKSEIVLNRLLKDYTCIGEIHWGRLHAQPGASLTNDASKYDMYSTAESFEDFYKVSKENLDTNEIYPNVSYFNYPYIYFNDEDLNSKITKHYLDTNNLIEGYLKDVHKNINIDRKITYGELDNMSDKLSQYLQTKSNESNEIIGLYATPSIEMIVGLLGILKAGCAYLPMDPNYPIQRINYMIKDSNVNYILTNLSKLEDDLLKDDIEFININEIETTTSISGDFKIKDVNNDGIAYLIYTSGSTGFPKGVLVSHKNILNTLEYRKAEYNLNSKDTVLQFFSFAFDGFLTSFFTPLISGSKIVLLNQNEGKDISRIVEIIKKQGISHFISVPQLYQGILEVSNLEDLKSLKTVTLAGDKTTRKIIDETIEINKNIEIVNEYGVTEAAVLSSILRHQEKHEEVNIGKPIRNTNIRIIDDYGYSIPKGITGELIIEGKGVARGYLNNPELTNTKFTINEANNKVYHTGDLAEFNKDSNIIFNGRKDFQVKVRGFRIELGEIEAQLSTFNGLREFVIAEKDDKNGGKYLCVYYVAEFELDVAEMREHLSMMLPDNMLPTFFMRLEELPRTISGKVNRQKLPDYEVNSLGEKISVPRNSIESKLVELWSEVLKIDKEKIGIDSNFFELGGQSLRATILESKLHKEFNVKVPITVIFQNPYIKEIAEYISQNSTEKYDSIQKSPIRDFYPQSSQQKRMFMLDKFDNISTTYHSIDVYQIDGPLEIEKLEEAIGTVIKRHEILRTTFELNNDNPVQVIHAPYKFNIEISDVGEKGNDVEYMKEQIKNSVKNLDLSKLPLFYSKIFKINPEKYIFLYDMHHILTDGTSHTIFVEEVIKLYVGEDLPELKIQYKDYSVWLQNQIEKGLYNKQMDFWKKHLKGDLPVLNLPTDRERLENQQFKGGVVTFSLSNEYKVKLDQLNTEYNTTLYTTLLTSLYTMLYRITNQEDIIVGCAISGRRHADVQNLVGLFVNTLAIRSYPVGRKTFKEYLLEVRRNVLDAFDNQDIQFEELITNLISERDPSRNPLFDVSFLMQNVETEDLKPSVINKLNSVNFSRYEYENEITQFDLALTCVEVSDRLEFNIKYSTALFEESTIKEFASIYKEVVKKIVSNINIVIDDIELSSQLQNAKVDIINEVEEGFKF